MGHYWNQAETKTLILTPRLHKIRNNLGSADTNDIGLSPIAQLPRCR
jgi:hypothetical protein